MVRKALRLADVLRASGYKESSLYEKMAAGKFPPGHKPDPKGKIRIWFEDEIEAWQKGEWKPEAEQAA